MERSQDYRPCSNFVETTRNEIEVIKTLQLKVRYQVKVCLNCCCVFILFIFQDSAHEAIAFILMQKPFLWGLEGKHKPGQPALGKMEKGSQFAFYDLSTQCGLFSLLSHSCPFIWARRPYAALGSTSVFPLVFKQILYLPFNNALF